MIKVLPEECRLITTIKIGGCLLTNKAEYKTADRRRIEEIGEELGVLIDKGAIKIDQTAIILGGGSYGNLVPKRYNLFPRLKCTKASDLSRMSLSQVELASEVINTWRRFGVPLQYFHFPSLLSESGGDHTFDHRLNTAPLLQSLSAGLMPVLMGDLIVNADGSTSIISSDVVPVLLSNSIRLARNIYVTNVPGVLIPSGGTRTTIASLSNSVMKSLGSVWYNTVGDITGGMKLKVDCSLELSRRGVLTQIIDGTSRGALEALLLHDEVLGTTLAPEPPAVTDHALVSSLTSAA